MKLLITDKIKKYWSIMEQSCPLPHSPRTADEFPDVWIQLQFWNTCPKNNHLSYLRKKYLNRNLKYFYMPNWIKIGTVYFLILISFIVSGSYHKTNHRRMVSEKQYLSLNIWSKFARAQLSEIMFLKNIYCFATMTKKICFWMLSWNI